MTKAQFQETIEAFEQKHQNNPVYYVIVEDGAISLDMKDDVEGYFPEPYIYYDSRKRCAIEPDRSLYKSKDLKSKDLIFRTPEQLRAALESYVANT